MFYVQGLENPWSLNQACRNDFSSLAPIVSYIVQTCHRE